MVATTNVGIRIERSLRALLGEVEELPETARGWASLADLDRASFSLEWDHLMADYLTELDDSFRAGSMTSDQQARFHNLLERLKAALPIVDRLGLYHPPISLDV